MTTAPVPSSPAAHLPFGEADKDSLDLMRMIGSLRRHLPLMAVTFGVVFVLVAGAISLLPKAYTSTALIQIITHQRNAADILPNEPNPGDSATADGSRMETEVEILQSREVAADALKQVGPYQPKTAPKASPLGDFIKGIRAQIAALAPKKAAAPVKPGTEADAAADALLKGVKVKRVGDSYVASVAYTAPDPERAAAVANAFVEAYQARKLLASNSSIDQSNAWLTTTLENLQKQVTQADSAVAQYKASHNLEQAGTSTTSEQNMSLISQQLLTAKAAESEADARYNAAQNQIAAGGNGSDIADVLASPVVTALRSKQAELNQKLSDLKARYGPRHPDVINAGDQLASIDAQIQTEIQRIVSNLRAQSQIAHQRTNALQGGLSHAKGELASNEAASVGLNELLRAQEGARTAYQEYLNRYKRTSAQQDIPQNDSRIIVRAAPSLQPSSIDLVKGSALAFAAGLVSAIGALILAQLLQGGFEDAADLERRLGARALSSIPALASTVRKRQIWPAPTDYVIQRPLSAFSESFRTLRTSVLSSSTGAPVQVVAFTSSLPGEGKTTTSVCFGRVSALGGARTVIMDCDLRRRALDRVIGRRAVLGSLDVMSGQASLDSVLIPDAVKEAFLLPLGGGDEDAHRNIFATPALDHLLEQLRSRFDLIVLDTSPVLALADAREVARKADATVLLARWRKTPRGAVEDAVRELDDVGARLVGVSLTQLDLTKQSSNALGKGSQQYYKHYSGYFTD